MGVFFYILSHNIIPIFFLIALGFIIAKKFEIQILSLTKLHSPGYRTHASSSLD